MNEDRRRLCTGLWYKYDSYIILQMQFRIFMISKIFNKKLAGMASL